MSWRLGEKMDGPDMFFVVLLSDPLTSQNLKGKQSQTYFSVSLSRHLTLTSVSTLIK